MSGLSPQDDLWFAIHDPSCVLLNQLLSDPDAMKKLTNDMNSYAGRLFAAESDRQLDQQHELEERERKRKWLKETSGQEVESSEMIVERLVVSEADEKGWWRTHGSER